MKKVIPTIALAVVALAACGGAAAKTVAPAPTTAAPVTEAPVVPTTLAPKVIICASTEQHSVPNDITSPCVPKPTTTTVAPTTTVPKPPPTTATPTTVPPTTAAPARAPSVDASNDGQVSLDEFGSVRGLMQDAGYTTAAAGINIDVVRDIATGVCGLIHDGGGMKEFQALVIGTLPSLKPLGSPGPWVGSLFTWSTMKACSTDFQAMVKAG